MGKTPNWLIKHTPKTRNIRNIRSIIDNEAIHTVCESALCPNIGECFLEKTVTFMILGKKCTRNCSFCAVGKGKPETPEKNEPGYIADAVKKLKLDHVVITSVTRDDLQDGGSGQFNLTINAIKRSSPNSRIEVLIPDLKGKYQDILNIAYAKPNILGHNLETVKKLYPTVRPQANYYRSLEVLKIAKMCQKGLYTKSGIMLGLGEKKEEVVELMEDLRRVDCDLLTIGQYIQPTGPNLEVYEYIRPEIFDEYRRIGESLNFKNVFSGPFVRSSYRAGEINV